MDEIEQRFECPYCFEWVTMILDISVEGTQVYIEDCEVCCRPIQIQFTSLEGELTSFSASSS